MGAIETGYPHLVRKSCKNNCVDSGAGNIEDEIKMFRKSCKDDHVDSDAGKIENEMCSSIYKLESGFVKQCYGKEEEAEILDSLKDSNENILWGGKNVLSGELSINGYSVALPDFQDNLIETSKRNVKIQHSLPSGYVSLAQLLDLKQLENGKDTQILIRQKELWQHIDLDKAERIEDGPWDKNGLRQRGNSGRKDRAPVKNEQKQRLNSGNNDQAQDRIEQTHERNLETERTQEQFQRGNSGNSNSFPNKSIRKDNHARMNGKIKSKALVNCSEMEGTYEKKEVGASKQGNPHENLAYPSKTKIMCESLSRIGGVSSSSTYKNEEMEEVNQGKIVPGLARKSEDISRKQLQIHSKVYERPDYCELKVNAEHKVYNGITGHVRQWRVKTKVTRTGPEPVKPAGPTGFDPRPVQISLSNLK